MTQALSRDRRRRARISARAAECVNHGWPVAALAVPAKDRCSCGLACTEPHLASDPVTSLTAAAELWAPGHPWEIALVTTWFDVVDLTSQYGALLHYRLVTSCPTAMAPRDRRWHFVVDRGSFPADTVEASGGVVHSGVDDWVPTSPTRTEATGKIGWLVHPQYTQWRPHQRPDLIAEVFFHALQKDKNPIHETPK